MECEKPTLERLKKRWQYLAVAQGPSSARGAVVIQALPRPHRGGGKRLEL